MIPHPTVFYYMVPTIGGRAIYHVWCSPWRRGRRRLTIMRVILDLTGY